MNLQKTHDFDHWNQAVSAVCGRFVTQRAQSPFIGDISHRDLGGLSVADIHVNARSICRQQANQDRGEDQFYFLVMQREGVMAINHDQQQFVLQPGDIALLDSAKTFEMCPQGLVHQLSVHLCRRTLDRALPARTKRFGKVPHTNLSGRVLAGLLAQIAEPQAEHRHDAQDGAAVQDALISLLQPCLQDSTDSPRGRPLRRMAEQLIQESLPHAPSPAELAARLNISVRQLYRQFEIDGDSICRYVQRQRLECSARDLLDDALRITTIAYKWGFSDSAHFSRVFKRQYGVSPRDYRVQTQHG
ncbi:Transcriptional activator FeaR [Pseudomonas sp. Bi70]|uniref:transcriptional regulator FeaR n=2 Tax=unclassified Pseudomonas TaxID=196821 RepID=UPI001DE7F4F1|nr:transcriptional regulator FeaR [Pseudomonas sp. Bi70]CAH0191209.1 Transcriptional activator FeaR [Pseudomonas sp. Bi70]